MTIRDNVRNVGPYSFTAHDAAVKLDQNESAWPLPDALRQQIAAALEQVELNRYPDLQPRRLAAGLARLHSWDAEGVTVAGGSNVLIQSAVIAAGVGRTVLTVSPTFAVYALQGQLLAGEVRQVPLGPGFSLPVAGLTEELQGGSGVVFIANPAAPTGNLHPRAELEQLIEAAADRWLFVIDEAYQQFADSDLSDLARSSNNVVVLRTMSKAVGLAGARLGYALSSPDIAEQLRKTILPFSVSELQEQVALMLLEHADLIADNVARTVQERQRMYGALLELPGVEPFGSSANFILFRVSAAQQVHERLLEGGVLIRRQDHLPGLAGCLRVSIGQPGENDLFLDTLTAIMNDRQKAGAGA